MQSISHLTNLHKLNSFFRDKWQYLIILYYYSKLYEQCPFKIMIEKYATHDKFQINLLLWANKPFILIW